MKLRVKANMKYLKFPAFEDYFRCIDDFGNISNFEGSSEDDQFFFPANQIIWCVIKQTSTHELLSPLWSSATDVNYPNLCFPNNTLKPIFFYYVDLIYNLILS